MFKKLVEDYNLKAIALVIAVGMLIGVIASVTILNYRELKMYREKYETLEQLGNYMIRIGVWDDFKVTLEAGD